MCLKNPLLFLDFDGVLNSAFFFQDRTAGRTTISQKFLEQVSRGWGDFEEKAAEMGEDPRAFYKAWRDIDPRTVPRLNRIIDHCSPEVIISSTWRLMYSKTLLQKILEEHGFTGQILDVTPNLDDYRTSSGQWVSANRGEEIAAWLSRKNRWGHRFAVLDDDSDMAGVREHLVQTSWESGLQDVHVEKVVTLLTEGPRPRHRSLSS